MLEYIKKFEAMIALGVEKNIFSKKEIVSLRGSSLGKTKFGTFLGFTIDSDYEFAIDYYGFFKKSRGFVNQVKELKETIVRKQVKAMTATVVHFPSLRIEHIFTLDPSLVAEFPQFKTLLIEKRGFKK